MPFKNGRRESEINLSELVLFGTLTPPPQVSTAE